MGNKAHWRKITGRDRLTIKKAWCYKADEFTMFNMSGLTEYGCYFNVFNNGHQHDFAVDFGLYSETDPMQCGPTTQAEQSFVPPTYTVNDNVYGVLQENYVGSLFIENDDGYLIVFCMPGAETSIAPYPVHNYGSAGAFVSIERGADNKKQQIASSAFFAPGIQQGFYLVTDDSNNSVRVGTIRQPVQNGNNPTYPDDDMIFKEDPIYMDDDGNVGGMFDNFKLFSVNYDVIPSPGAHFHDGRCMRTTDKDGNKQLWVYIGSKCWVPIDSLDFGTINGNVYVDSQGASGETIDRTIT